VPVVSPLGVVLGPFLQRYRVLILVVDVDLELTSDIRRIARRLISHGSIVTGVTRSCHVHELRVQGLVCEGVLCICNHIGASIRLSASMFRASAGKVD
jgi:hypothetical protein